MQAVISWTVPPRKNNIGILTAGIDAFCKAYGYSPRDSVRLQACVEGVFAYCMGNINAIHANAPIGVQLFRGDNEVKVVMKHNGPGGEWDNVLQPKTDAVVKRTCFDSMGLFIADEMLHDLVFKSQFDVVTGHSYKEYEMLYRLRWTDDVTPEKRM